MALARALITEPKVLLLDEPLSALDPFLRIQMRAELRRLQKDLGLTFIHVTHSQEEAMALADTMVVMNAGRIEQVGSPHEIYNRPVNEFVARFMGGHNVLKTAHGPVAVRNDRIRLTPEAIFSGELVAQVTDIEYQGTYVLVGLQGRPPGAHAESSEFAVAATLPEAEFDALPYAVGDRVGISWAPAHAHALQTA